MSKAEKAPGPLWIEVVGETCIDGGTCHHSCTEKCFRRVCSEPLAGYKGPWAYVQGVKPSDRYSDLVSDGRMDPRNRFDLAAGKAGSEKPGEHTRPAYGTDGHTHWQRGFAAGAASRQQIADLSQQGMKAQQALFNEHLAMMTQAMTDLEDKLCEAHKKLAEMKAAEPVIFPVLTGKLWSSTEVQEWLGEHVNKKKAGSL